MALSEVQHIRYLVIRQVAGESFPSSLKKTLGRGGNGYLCPDWSERIFLESGRAAPIGARSDVSAQLRGPRHPLDRQVESGLPEGGGVALGALEHLGRGLAHALLELEVDGVQLPAELLDVLDPLEVG